MQKQEERIVEVELKKKALKVKRMEAYRTAILSLSSENREEKEHELSGI